MTLFLPCHPPNNPKNQNFEKIKNTPGDIIILHKWQSSCIVLDISGRIYHETEFFCHFGLYFAPLPPNNPENQKFEKMKKAPRGVIIYTSVP